MDKIFERPVLYLDRPSVSHMQAFLDGFAVGSGIENPKISDPLYYEFHDWLAGRFGIGHSDSWSNIVESVADSEQEAFDLAKKLWEAYKTELRQS